MFIPSRPRACQTDLQIKSCAYNGHIIWKSKLLHLPIFFLIIPYCFIYLLCLICFLNNSLILECKHHIKAKAGMLEKNNSASPNQMSPVSLPKCLLNILWIHRELWICWNYSCWVWGLKKKTNKKHNLVFTESNFPLWYWFCHVIDSKTMRCYTVTAGLFSLWRMSFSRALSWSVQADLCCCAVQKLIFSLKWNWEPYVIEWLQHQILRYNLNLEALQLQMS